MTKILLATMAASLVIQNAHADQRFFFSGATPFIEITGPDYDRWKTTASTCVTVRPGICRCASRNGGDQASIRRAVMIALPEGPCPGAGFIQVTSATLGQNCRGAGLIGNRTAQVASRCNGRAACSVTGKDVRPPDPAYGCPKDFLVDYQCTGRPGMKRAYAAAVADETTPVNPSCP
jgi:hypothetical protein